MEKVRTENRGGKRAGAGVKPGMKNALKPEIDRHTIAKSVVLTDQEWKDIKKDMAADGHTTFAKWLRAKIYGPELFKNNPILAYLKRI